MNTINKLINKCNLLQNGQLGDEILTENTPRNNTKRGDACRLDIELDRLQN